jgi:hypothetical protein
MGLTRQSSATAGGSKRGELNELFHKIKCAHRDGQRLAVPDWLAFIIRPNRCVFSLSTPKVVEKLTMSLQTELIIPVLVVLNPLDQFIEHGLLILWRGKLFGFPCAAMTVSYANLNARIQEPQVGAVGKRRLNQVAVTSLDNPLITYPNEVIEFAKANIQRFALWAFVPSDCI